MFFYDTVWIRNPTVVYCVSIFTACSGFLFYLDDVMRAFKTKRVSQLGLIFQRSFIYSLLSRSFTARGFTSGDPTEGITIFA